MPSCLTPLTLYRKDKKSFRGDVGINTDVVPCGKCPNCIKRRQNQWIYRLTQEQQVSQSSAFITLTYENCPLNEKGYPTLLKEDHQKFIKRLRKRIRKDRFKYNITPNTKIKYYAVGEYGTKYWRPHYHSILFNLPDAYIQKPEIITDIWGKGITQVAECNQKTIAYVTKYISKKQNQEILDANGQLREFSLMSKGMGANWLTENKTKWYKEKLHPYLLIEDGKKIPMPRYYRTKMYSESEQKKLARSSKIYQQENQPYNSAKHEIEYVQQQINQFKKEQKLKRIKI